MTDLRPIGSLLLAVAFATIPCMARTELPQDANAPVSLDSGVRSAIDEDVAGMLKAAHIAGATVLVARDGGVVYARAFGKRNVAGGLSAGLRTEYEVGSITKQMTAAAIVQLSETGKLQLDAPLATYLPDAPHARDVTIRQLLTHTSGIPEYMAALPDKTALRRPATFDSLVGSIAGKPLDFSPGTKFAHSNTNYILLGRVIEVVSGERWADYANAHLFGPAGMHETSTVSREPKLAQMATGYAFAKGRLQPAIRFDDSWASSAGDVVTTAGDLAKWNAALASGRIVSRSDYQLMMRPQLLANGSSSGYGFGEYVDTYRWQPRTLAQGDTFGFDAADQYFPDRHVRIIVLANTEDAETSDSTSVDIGERIFDDMFSPASDAGLGNTTEPAGKDPKRLYSEAIGVMDQLNQPAFVSYRLQGESDNEHIGLQTIRGNVWLLFNSGLAPTIWEVKHRTLDYASEVIEADSGKRYASERPIFDPTWFGAYRALKSGMLGYQNAAAPRSSLSIAQTASAPASDLKTIGTVTVIGPGIYEIRDRGAATCENGDPGWALHLVSRRRDPRHQLTDVVVDLSSMRFCSIRYNWNEALWFRGIIEQHYADVEGYWVVTGGYLDGTERAFGISTHHFTWRYKLTDLAFPADLPDSTFAAGS